MLLESQAETDLGNIEKSFAYQGWPEYDMLALHPTTSGQFECLMQGWLLLAHVSKGMEQDHLTSWLAVSPGICLKRGSDQWKRALGKEQHDCAG